MESHGSHGAICDIRIRFGYREDDNQQGEGILGSDSNSVDLSPSYRLKECFSDGIQSVFPDSQSRILPKLV